MLAFQSDMHINLQQHNEHNELQHLKLQYLGFGPQLLVEVKTPIIARIGRGEARTCYSFKLGFKQARPLFAIFSQNRSKTY